jgi:hypothetical protein
MTMAGMGAMMGAVANPVGAGVLIVLLLVVLILLIGGGG